MNYNFFDWVREGVCKSVLGGVEDAVNTLGMPPDTDSKDKLLGFLKSDTVNEPPVRRITGTASGRTKALGRNPLGDSQTVKEA
ncbi:MAG: hypothetical protein LBH00_03265 [Planctomycetaceae bacterium]|jgi:hypothetical protein|nr:hypothetical protein [Planctomycetaceae bacterium]